MEVSYRGIGGGNSRLHGRKMKNALALTNIDIQIAHSYVDVDIIPCELPVSIVSNRK